MPLEVPDASEEFENGEQKIATTPRGRRYEKIRMDLDRSEDRFSCGEKVVTGFLEAVAEALLSFFEVTAWVVNFLVSDFAVDFKHTFDVFADVSSNRAGECILGVGVDVHLNHTVSESFTDVVEV